MSDIPGLDAAQRAYDDMQPPWSFSRWYCPACEEYTICNEDDLLCSNCEDKEPCKDCDGWFEEDQLLDGRCSDCDQNLRDEQADKINDHLKDERRMP
jgi:hypothetical protein